MQLYAPEDAWEAFDRKNYQLASHIWLALLPTAGDVVTLLRYQLGYCAVLMARHHYHEALQLIEELYESTADCVCLHQLGCLAKAQDKLDTARAHFMAEQTALAHTDTLALALNAYELGCIALEQGKETVAFHYARRSLEYAQKAQHKLTEGYAHYLLGRVRQLLRDPEKAQDCFEAAQKALKQAPACPLRESGEVRLVSLCLHDLPVAA